MTEKKKDILMVDQLKPGAEFTEIELPDEFLKETHVMKSLHNFRLNI